MLLPAALGKKKIKTEGVKNHIQKENKEIAYTYEQDLQDHPVVVATLAFLENPHFAQ